jgi:predicted ribosomally synthesized peptide with nif11-like leader
MGSDAVDRFYECLAEDEDMQKAYTEAMDRVCVEAVAGFAADNGFEFTTDELAESWACRSDELSDEDLEGVAGGTARTTFSARGRAMVMMFKVSQNAIANFAPFKRSPGTFTGPR